MALVEVKVPQLSESVSEATLLQWKKKTGDAVARDEVLVEIETDKVVLEVPASSAGTLGEIVMPDGSTVTSDQVIAKIDTDGAATPAAAPAAAAPAVAAPAQAPAPQQAAPAPAPAAPARAPVAMPAAAKILAENDLAPGGVAGTGRDGRITKGDALGAVASGASAARPPATNLTSTPAPAPTSPAPAGPASTASLDGRTEQRVPMSRLRQRVAERLVQSQSTAAILTTFNEVNMAADPRPAQQATRIKLRKGTRRQAGLHVVSSSRPRCTCAEEISRSVNASIDGTDIIYHGYFDIGIAVRLVLAGLVVPILRDADQMSLRRYREGRSPSTAKQVPMKAS